MLSRVVGGIAVPTSNFTVGQDYCGVVHKTKEDCLADKDGICEWCTSPSPPGPVCLTIHMTPDTFQCEKPSKVAVGQDYCGVMHKTREDCLADKDGICEWCTSPSPPGPVCLTTHLTPDTFKPRNHTLMSLFERQHCTYAFSNKRRPHSP